MGKKKTNVQNNSYKIDHNGVCVANGVFWCELPYSCLTIYFDLYLTLITVCLMWTYLSFSLTILIQ